MQRTLPLIAALLFPAPAFAQTALAPRPLEAIPANKESQVEAQKFRGVRVSGRELKSRVKRLNKELEWHDSIEDAAKVAQQTGKPIFWLQMLGDLDGHT